MHPKRRTQVLKRKETVELDVCGRAERRGNIAADCNWLMNPLLTIFLR